MSRPPIRSEQLNENFALSEFHKSGDHPQGFWLYDETIGWNIAIAEPTEKAALLEGLEYYRNQFAELKERHDALQAKVDSFVAQFIDTEEQEA